jgi:hypothetical protein
MREEGVDAAIRKRAAFFVATHKDDMAELGRLLHAVLSELRERRRRRC